jgi:methylmalonyl-CoA/ethylmalonyl-CoA epimerase
MIKKIEHLGIAVKEMDRANSLFESLLNTKVDKIEEVKSEQVRTSFFQVGESKIELLEATGPDSAIAKYIDKRGEGIHHIAFLTDDLNAEVERLKKAGFQALMDAPKDGADNKRIIFFHPRSTNGILVELCEEKS